MKGLNMAFFYFFGSLNLTEMVNIVFSLLGWILIINLFNIVLSVTDVSYHE